MLFQVIKAFSSTGAEVVGEDIRFDENVGGTTTTNKNKSDRESLESCVPQSNTDHKTEFYSKHLEFELQRVHGIGFGSYVENLIVSEDGWLLHGECFVRSARRWMT
uniref:MATH domain-containing protein n=1 Tax=Ascaris lumbricoides TaxID=6252 RepID=A0A0M3HV64_ASCLU